MLWLFCSIFIIIGFMFSFSFALSFIHALHYLLRFRLDCKKTFEAAYHVMCDFPYVFHSCELVSYIYFRSCIFGSCYIISLM